MPLLQLIVLAVVQGITEFLPISSSGHLVLTWAAFDRLGLPAVESEAARLDLDVAVHVGTLLAVCLYTWRDLFGILKGVTRLSKGFADPSLRLLAMILIGTLPIIVVGFVFKDLIVAHARSVEVIAWTTIGFGILLWLGDRVGMLIRKVEHLTAGQALIIGLAQVLALVPGTSRSGITMTAARFLGFERAEAARFSLLLAIPAIAGAGLLAGLDLRESGDLQLGRDALLAAAFSFVTALVAIVLMMRWLKGASFTPFVVYRLLLGAALLWWVYS